MTVDRIVKPASGPVIAMLGAVLAAAVLAILASLGGAGDTPAVSGWALAAWLVGSILGLLLFAQFRAVNNKRRSNPWYVEPAWRPTRIAQIVVVVGWLIGTWGAVMVAESMARA